MNQGLLKSYVATILILAAALATALGNAHPLIEIGGLLAVLIWTFAVGSQSVAFPKHRVQISAADCFIFYCLIVHGPLGGMIAAFVGTLGALQLGSGRPNPQQAAFNLGAVPLCAGLAGYIFEMLRGDSSFFVALLAAAAVFALTNTVVVSIVLKLAGKASLREALLVPATGFIVSVFVTALAGGFLAQASATGPRTWTVAAIVAVCFLVGTVISIVRSRFVTAQPA